jgi:chromosome segregation ATPase
MEGVTLEGTVIHRSGLITGGQGSSSSRKFDDTEVDRMSFTIISRSKLTLQDSRSSKRNTLRSSRRSTSPNPRIKAMKVF